MKYLLFFLILASLSFTPPPKGEPIYIVKTSEGFDIYSHDKELLLEFTTINSDKNTLEDLSYIYETAKEQREGKEEEMRKETKHIQH